MKTKHGEPDGEPGPRNQLHMVNLWQTKDERAAKYWLAKACGANSYWAQRMRDWHLPKIERFFGLS